MAKKLLDQFGNIQSTLKASSEQLLSVEGMGNKTVSKIQEFLTF